MSGDSNPHSVDEIYLVSLQPPSVPKASIDLQILKYLFSVTMVTAQSLSGSKEEVHEAFVRQHQRSHESPTESNAGCQEESRTGEEQRFLQLHALKVNSVNFINCCLFYQNK